MIDLDELIAEARQCHQARGWSKDPLVDKLENLANRLADALEAAGAERDEAWRLAAEQTRLERDRAERAEAERDAALARIAEAAKLHRKYTYYEYEDSCPDTTDEHREEHHHEASDGIGEFYCDQMPTGDVVCDTCRDVNGDRMEWPCVTIAALDGGR